MTTDHITDTLSAYVDDELDAAERARVERHVSACAECADALDAARRVRDHARGLTDRAPVPAAADAIWAGIAAGAGFRTDNAAPLAPSTPVTPLHAAPARRRRTLLVTIPQLAAAGIALALLTGGVVWRLARAVPTVQEQVATLDPDSARDARGTRADTPGIAGPTVVTPRGSAVLPSRGVLADPAPRQYAADVADLEAVLNQHRARLDSATVRAIQESLATVDRAIREARAALARDPENAYLNDHLAATMARKLRLLRDAALVAGGQS